MSEMLKVNAVSSVTTKPQTQTTENKEKKKLINHEFTTTEKVIGGISALTILGLGIYAVVKKGKPQKRIKISEPEINQPHVEPQPEIQTPKPEPIVEKPVEQEVEKVVEKNFKEQKQELVKTAISPEEFNKIGKIEKGRAILNSGESYTGAILTAGENGFGKRYLREYQDGVLREMTEMQVSPKGNIFGTTNFSFKNWKYDKNGKMIERSSFDAEEGTLEYVRKYFKDLEGNKIKETFRIGDSGNLELGHRLIDTGINTISEKIYSDKIFRVVKSKNGNSKTFIENLKSGDIIPLPNRFEEIFKDSDGVPKYKIFHGYNLESEPFQFVEVYSKDGKTRIIYADNKSMTFKVSVPKGQKADDIDYNHAIYNIEEEKIQIRQSGTLGYIENFELKSKGNIIEIKDPSFHGGCNSPDNKIGTYNIETGEIKCDPDFEKEYDNMPKFSEQIKEIIERIYGTEKPVPIKQLYEQKMKIVNDLLNNKELKPEKVEVPW